MDKYNWEGTNYSSKNDDWKQFGENNLTITLNVQHVKKGKIYPAYISKQNSKCEEQVIILMILNREG